MCLDNLEVLAKHIKNMSEIRAEQAKMRVDEREPTTLILRHVTNYEYEMLLCLRYAQESSAAEKLGYLSKEEDYVENDEDKAQAAITNTDVAR